MTMVMMLMRGFFSVWKNIANYAHAIMGIQVQSFHMWCLC